MSLWGCLAPWESGYGPGKSGRAKTAGQRCWHAGAPGPTRKICCSSMSAGTTNRPLTSIVPSTRALDWGTRRARLKLDDGAKQISPCNSGEKAGDNESRAPGDHDAEEQR